ncbi:HK97 gp10 family phage protein [Acetoanaerobium noterae]|uniref:HK97 gp10 family phage protein n=1 Tax=Acetoanaerobium noterae TaxID=745369 RepID=UPI0033313B57
MDGFDFGDLVKLEHDLVKQAKIFEKGKYSKAFLRKESKKLKKLVLKNAKSKVKERTGKLFEGIKAGKVYNYAPEKALAVRVYGGSPAYHIHLLEYGHRVVKDGKEIGFVKGKYFFEDSANQFMDTYYDDIEKFLDEVLDKGL